MQEFQRQIQGVPYFKNKREKMLEKILQGAYHKETEIYEWGFPKPDSLETAGYIADGCNFMEKGWMDLERIISALISFDKAGQEIVQKAKDEQQEELLHIDADKQEMYRTYRERLERDLERFRQAAASEQEEAMARTEREYRQRLEKLREIYLENSDKWVKEIFARCTAL